MTTTTTHTTVKVTEQVYAQVTVVPLTKAPSGKVTNWGLAARLCNPAGDPATDDYTDFVGWAAKTRKGAQAAIDTDQVQLWLGDLVREAEQLHTHCARCGEGLDGDLGEDEAGIVHAGCYVEPDTSGPADPTDYPEAPSLADQLAAEVAGTDVADQVAAEDVLADLAATPDVPTPEQLAEATARAEAERAAAEAAKPKRQAKPKAPASELGSDAWKQLRDHVHQLASVDGKLAPEGSAERAQAIEACLQARSEGVAWAALDVITRDASVRGLNKLVWEAHQAARKAS